MMHSENIDTGRAWLAGLASSMTVEHDYYAQVEGQLPEALQGTLYRNGPGRFDLGGVRKQHLLDGDGMIQAFDFQDGRVRYRNRFVRTEKYLAEEQAGHLSLPTWTTRAPGGVLKNMGNRIKSQAGVTVVVKHGRLYAFDEVGLPYGLDLQTLDTLGEQQLGPPGAHIDYKAHTKTDPKTGAWLLLGIENGPRMHLHLAEHSVDGALQRHQRIAAPRSFYIHDWFATEHYALVLLHPVKLSLAKFLSGWASFTDSLQWKPELGNLLLVIDREGIKAPIVLETSACFMWHSVNAFEMKDSIIADFVGYDEPDHFLGSNAAFKAIMQKRQGEQNYAGTVRRYLINLEQKQITEDVLSRENHEFPIVNPRLACYRSRYGYFSTASHSTAFHNGLARLDLDTGKRDAVHLGDDYHLGEPIFVPDGLAANEPGWLLSLGLDGKSGYSFLGVFRAERLADGPVARVLLNHSTPLSFHGWWHRRSV